MPATPTGSAPTVAPSVMPTSSEPTGSLSSPPTSSEPTAAPTALAVMSTAKTAAPTQSPAEPVTVTLRIGGIYLWELELDARAELVHSIMSRFATAFRVREQKALWVTLSAPTVPHRARRTHEQSIGILATVGLSPTPEAILAIRLATATISAETPFKVTAGRLRLSIAAAAVSVAVFDVVPGITTAKVPKRAAHLSTSTSTSTTTNEPVRISEAPNKASSGQGAKMDALGQLLFALIGAAAFIFVFTIAHKRCRASRVEGKAWESSRASSLASSGAHANTRENRLRPNDGQTRHASTTSVGSSVTLAVTGAWDNAGSVSDDFLHRCDATDRRPAERKNPLWVDCATSDSSAITMAITAASGAAAPRAPVSETDTELGVPAEEHIYDNRLGLDQVGGDDKHTDIVGAVDAIGGRAALNAAEPDVNDAETDVSEEHIYNNRVGCLDKALASIVLAGMTDTPAIRGGDEYTDVVGTDDDFDATGGGAAPNAPASYGDDAGTDVFEDRIYDYGCRGENECTDAGTDVGLAMGKQEDAASDGCSTPESSAEKLDRIQALLTETRTTCALRTRMTMDTQGTSKSA